MTMVDERPADQRAQRVLSKEVERELLKHPGKWIAMTAEKILAIGDDSVSVYRSAVAAGEPQPILYRVPETGTSYFY